jgi:hypothetical protein
MAEVMSRAQDAEYSAGSEHEPDNPQAAARREGK